MSDTRKAGTISTFANKAREMRQSLDLCASQYKATTDLLKNVMSRCNDLPMLASELGLDEDGLGDVEQIHSGVNREAVELVATMMLCQQRIEALAARIGDQYAPYVSKSVVSPLRGVYTASTLARRVAGLYTAKTRDS